MHRDISDLPIAVQLPWLSEGCYVLAGPGATASSTPFIHVFLPLPKTSRGCQWSVHAWARACARTHTHTQWKRESFVPVCSTRTSLPFPHISGRLETQYRKAYCFLRDFLSEQQETVIVGLFVLKRAIKTHWIKSASSNGQLWKFFSLLRSLYSKCFCALLPVKEQRLIKGRLWETSLPSGSDAEQVGTSLLSPWQSHCWRPKLGWEVLPIITMTPALNIEFSLLANIICLLFLRFTVSHGAK